jgi:hypothetical protein
MFYSVGASAGSVSVRFVLLLGAAIVNSPVPLALGLSLMEDKMVLLQQAISTQGTQ